MARSRRSNIDASIDYIAWLRKNNITTEPDSSGNVRMICPKCQHDEFYFNIHTGKFQCWRKNNCGITGNAFTLVKEFGFEPLDLKRRQRKRNIDLEILEDEIEIEAPDFSNYANDLIPVSLNGNYTSSVPEWIKKLFEKKKISIEALEIGKVLYSDKDKNLAFPRIKIEDVDGEEKNVVYGIKFRNSPSNRKNKFTQAKGSQPVFYNYHNVPKNFNTLIIAEGETDTLSFLTLGFTNVLGIPNGSSGNCESWINANKVILNEAKEIILALDNDNAGNTTCRSFIREYTGKAIVKRLDLEEFKDVNEFMIFDKERLLYNMNVCETLVSDNIIKLSSIKDALEDQYIETGFTPFNYLLGGIREGEVTVLLGRAGSGKTTLVYQFSAYSADAGIRVGILSGEMTIPKTKKWIYSKMLPKKYIEYKTNKYNDNFYSININQDLVKHLDKIYNDYISLYDNVSWDKDVIIEKIKSLARSGHKIIILDNLTVVDVGDDELKGTKELMNNIRQIAILFGCHIFVVSHPRKTSFQNSTKELELEDIHGSSSVEKLTFNGITITRQDENDQYIEATTILKGKKVREHGAYYNLQYTMNFEKESSSFVASSSMQMYHPFNTNKEWKWQKELTREDLEKIFKNDRKVLTK